MGISLAFLAAIFASTKDIFSKSLSKSISGSVSAFTSFAFALPFYLILLFILYLLGFEDFYYSKNFFYYVILRAVSDSFAEFFKMHAYSHAELSVVSSIFSLNLVLLLLISPMITGDIPSSYGTIGVILSAFGSFFIVTNKSKSIEDITKENTEENKSNKKGIIYALLAAFFFALNACFDRLAVQSASATLSGFAMTALSCLILLPLALRVKDCRNEVTTNSKALSYRAFFEVTFMVTKLAALKYIQAPYVSAIMRATLIFSIIGGKVFFNEENFKKKMIGGVLIIAGSLLIIMNQ